MMAKNKNIFNMNLKSIIGGVAVGIIAVAQISCKPNNKGGVSGSSELAGDAAQKVYVAPGTR
jgi:nitrous-oxide reductase